LIAITGSGPCWNVDPRDAVFLCAPLWSFQRSQPASIASKSSIAGLALFAWMARGNGPYAPEQLPQALKRMQDDPIPQPGLEAQKQGGLIKGTAGQCHFSNFTGVRLVEAARPCRPQLQRAGSRPWFQAAFTGPQPGRARGIPLDADAKAMCFCSG